MKKILSWFVATTGISLGLLILAIIGVKSADSLRADWLPISALVSYALLLVAGSLVAILNRGWAGAILLFSVTAVAVLVGAVAIDQFRDGTGWLSDAVLGLAIGASPPVILGGFWLVTRRLGWPPVFPQARHSWRRTACTILVAAVVIAVCLFAAATTFALRMSLAQGDCGGSPLFVRPKSREQAVFVVKVVKVTSRFNGGPIGEIAVGKIQKTYWAPRMWISPYVLLAPGGFEEGQIYLIDGTRWHGLLSQFLPGVELAPCGWSDLGERSVEFQLLEEGVPPGRIRLIGEVNRWTHTLPAEERVPGVKITITGPEGSASTETDSRGIYDVGGLPPGEYSIAAEGNPWQKCATNGTALKAGDAWGCDFNLQ